MVKKFIIKKLRGKRAPLKNGHKPQFILIKKIMKKKIYYLYGLFLTATAQAQSLSPTIINSAGGTGIINNIVFDYSFGEMALINTFSTPKLIVTQGLLQTKTDTVAIGIAKNEYMPNIIVFPNPAQQHVCFESTYQTGGELNYELLDVAGKQIIGKQLTVHTGKIKETIDLNNLPIGMYLLKITVKQGKDTFMQTSKIQKVN